MHRKVRKRQSFPERRGNRKANEKFFPKNNEITQTQIKLYEEPILFTREKLQEAIKKRET